MDDNGEEQSVKIKLEWKWVIRQESHLILSSVADTLLVFVLFLG
jgi:hypothetical protein